jgi:hypothetical protein
MPPKITVGSGPSQKLVVTSAPKNRVTINNNQGIGSQGIQTLVQLKDVDATHVSNNETVVYDVASGKFKIEELPIVNGGEF